GLPGIAFRNGTSPIVTTRGPGILHLLSFESNSRLPNVIGFTETTNTGVTRFIISHSYTFTASCTAIFSFSFYWEGADVAVWTVGDNLARQPLGNSWAEAVCIPWSGQAFSSTDVQAAAQSAVVRDNQVTCFIIPPL
ncbi:hypothetical protein C8J57DRAFT_1128504, partial [Mycena rebaudengoi]